MKAQVFTTNTSASDVGFGRVARELVPCLLCQTEHHFGVDEILRAAEGDQANLHLRLRLDTGFRVQIPGFGTRNPVSVQRTE
jgi:hypothetical protein